MIFIHEILCLYPRKSQEDRNRQIQSIPRQYEWCKKVAARRGLKIDVFFEDSHSGHRLGRPGFKKMIEQVEASIEPIGIITWKISRLARNPIDEGIIKYAFMRGKITHIIARDREYKEGESQIIMGVDFGQATQYSIELSKDVTEGMRKKIDKGYRPVRAPYGYKNDPSGKQGERKIYVDALYFKPIQQLFRLCLTGCYNVAQLQNIVNNEWKLRTKHGKPFGLSTIHGILRNRFYYGEYLWKGRIEQGIHTPMITKAEFLKIQKIINRKGLPYQSKQDNHFSGLVKCKHCGCSITGYSKSKTLASGNAVTYDYLKCIKNKGRNCCPQKPLNRSEVDKQIVDLLQHLRLPEPIVDFLMQQIAKIELKKEAQCQCKTKHLNIKLDNLKNEKKELIRKLAKGVIDDAMFQMAIEALEEDIDAVEIQLKPVKRTHKSKLQRLKRTFDFSKRANQKYANGTCEDKRIILKTIGANYGLKGRILNLELHPMFKCLKKISDALNQRCELKETSMVMGKNKGNGCSDSVWWGILDELRTALTTSEVEIPLLSD